MPQRTVLRVDSSVELSDLQLKNIALLNGVELSELKIERKNLSTIELDLLYKQRFASVCNGAKFLLDNLPLDFPSMNTRQRQALYSYIEQLQKSFINSLYNEAISNSDYSNILYEHSRLLTSAFNLRLDKNHKTAVHMLSKGEEYFMLTHPRDDLMTLTKINNTKGNFYILQTEAQLPPFSDTLINDYWAVSQPNLVKPEWFESLEPLEQRLLKNVLNNVKSKEEISKVMVNLSSRLRTLPGAANFRNHIVTIFDEDLKTVQSYQRSASSMISSRDVQSKSQAVRDFHALENLKQVVEQVSESKIKNELKKRTLNDGDKIIIEVPGIVQTLVSPVIPSFVQPDFKLVVDKERAVNSFVFEQEKIRQTTDKDGNNIAVTVLVKVKFDSMNHPLNYANRWDYTLPDDKSCQKFITNVKKFLIKDPTHTAIAEINELLSQYSLLLEKGSLYHVNYNDFNMREIFLSSLEQLITVRQNGIAYGSCVSAKDRKALEFMHTDAMELYHQWYGSWPKYSDVANFARAKFTDIFVNLYVSRHHQCSASLNAPGSEGIKTPYMYLPSDIIKSIESYYAKYNPDLSMPLVTDDILASMNELRSIVKSLSSWSTYDIKALESLTAIETLTANKNLEPKTTLSTSIKSEFYILASLNLISILVAAKSDQLKFFWNGNTSIKANLLKFGGIFNNSRPDGVKLIHSLIEQNGAITTDLNAKIFNVVNRRLSTKTPYVRFKATTEFYKLIELMFYGVTESDIKGVYQALCKFYCKATGKKLQDVMKTHPEQDSMEQSGLTFFTSDETLLEDTSGSLNSSNASGTSNSNIDSPSIL